MSPRLRNGGPTFIAPALWSGDASPGTPLDAEDQATLAAISSISRFRRGEDIYLEDCPAVSAFNIITGVVEAYRIREDRRHIVGFFFPGDIIGLAERGRYVNSVKAVTPVTLYRINAAALEARLRRNPALDFHLISRLCHELREAQHHGFMLGQRRAEAKIGLFLQMLDTHGRTQGKPAGTLDLPMPRKDIGAYTGLSPEAVSRALKRLTEEGIIRQDGPRRVRILDAVRLEAMVAG